MARWFYPRGVSSLLPLELLSLGISEQFVHRMGRSGSVVICVDLFDGNWFMRGRPEHVLYVNSMVKRHKVPTGKETKRSSLDQNDLCGVQSSNSNILFSWNTSWSQFFSSIGTIEIRCDDGMSMRIGEQQNLFPQCTQFSTWFSYSCFPSECRQ